jgi:carboxypeptidase family protein
MGRLPDLGLSRARTRAAIAAAILGIAAQTAIGGHDRGTARGAAEGQTAGTIRGTITSAQASTPEPVAVKQDEAVCGKTQPDPSLVIGPGGAVANVVVLVAGTKGAAGDASVVNKQCRFVPHVQVAAPGKPLRIGSEDSVLHTTHAYAEDERSLFNVAIPMAGLTVSRPVEKSKIVRLQCDTHPWMRGYVLITDERAAVTGADGRFQIDGVPPGTYELRVWHEKLKGPPQSVTVAAGATAEVRFTVAP